MQKELPMVSTAHMGYVWEEYIILEKATHYFRIIVLSAEQSSWMFYTVDPSWQSVPKENSNAQNEWDNVIEGI